MLLVQLEDHLKKKHPGKKIKFKFTPECFQSYEIALEEGHISHTGSLTANKVRVEIEGEDPYMEELEYHNQEAPFSHFKAHFNRQASGYVPTPILQQIKAEKDVQAQLQQLLELAVQSLEPLHTLRNRMLAAPDLPPEAPQPPNTDGLTEEEKAEKLKEYEDAHQEWYNENKGEDPAEFEFGTIFERYKKQQNQGSNR